MFTFKKSELVKSVAADCDINRTLAEAVIESTFNNVKKAVDYGYRVTVKDFGTFSKKTTPAGVRRNPATGGNVQVAEKSVIKLKGTTL